MIYVNTLINLNTHKYVLFILQLLHFTITAVKLATFVPRWEKGELCNCPAINIHYLADAFIQSDIQWIQIHSQ